MKDSTEKKYLKEDRKKKSSINMPKYINIWISIWRCFEKVKIQDDRSRNNFVFSKED